MPVPEYTFTYVGTIALIGAVLVLTPYMDSPLGSDSDVAMGLVAVTVFSWSMRLAPSVLRGEW